MASFASASTPELRFYRQNPPIIGACQGIVSGKRGVFVGGFAWHERFLRTHRESNLEADRLESIEGSFFWFG